MKKRATAGLIILFIVVTALLSLQAIKNPQKTIKADGKKIGVIEINGMITGSSTSSALFGSSTVNSRDIMDIIKQARERPDIKAVVVRIDSPGGTAVASQEIGIEMDKLRESGKPVIISMGDVCASGGYWIACSSDYIVANGATLTGSIGVIMELQNLEGLLEKLGIEEVVIKSGQHKDIGSPYRELTKEEEQILKDLVQESYDQFLAQVLKGRKDKITQEELVKIADGRIFSGTKAIEYGIVDKLGNYYDAIDIAKEMAGIEGEATVEILNKTDFWGRLLSDFQTAALLNHQPGIRLRY